MEFSFTQLALLSVCIFVVAFLYSSVGHGGASGYLAILSFLSLSSSEMATTALILNIIVAGVALVNYFKRGYFSFNLVWPFVITSIPAAFLGGLIPLKNHTYYIILAVILFFAAWQLAFKFSIPEQGKDNASFLKPISLSAALPTGGVIGLISGMIGIGGGIFLSPIMLLSKWADAKHVSATSAAFILVNAMSGLGGRFARGDIQIGSLLTVFLISGFLGGIAGSYFGAKHFSGVLLRRILAIVLVIASIKLILQAT